MITYSLIIPVYKNSQNIDSLIKNLSSFFSKFSIQSEVVFVIDGNPEKEYQLLRKVLTHVPFSSQLILHSKNFGSFAAMRTGLKHARGRYLAIMAADEQEPLSLIETFFSTLSENKYELLVGSRNKRVDPWLTTLTSGIFWKMYRRLINSEIPDGGVDVFACTSRFRDELLQMSEANSSLIGQIFWLGFDRKIIYYNRQKRKDGKSAWTFSKKFNYMVDSIFSFTDLPLKLLILIGCLGVILSVILALITLYAKSIGEISVPGYSSTFLIVTFFGSINIVCVGIVGLYIHRIYENTKHRPISIVSKIETFISKRDK